MQKNAECYYYSDDTFIISNPGGGLNGLVYTYGFNGWDGKNKATCKLTKISDLYKEQTYFTSQSSFLLFKDSDVCGYVVTLKNTAPSYKEIVLAAISARWIIISLGMTISIISGYLFL